MYPVPIQKLIELFTKFPGIGPRQATRFAFFILKEKNSLVEDLRGALSEVREKISICNECFRTTEREERDEERCAFCRDSRRDHRLIAVVEKESDMLNLEKAGAYHGRYHVLGGVISPLDPDSPRRIRLRELHERVRGLVADDASCEVILATNPTTEGDTTALYIERILSPFKDQHPALKISRLGRGLSLGSELEYVDEMTIKNALNNRK